MEKQKITAFSEKDFQALVIICDKMTRLNAKTKELSALGKVYSFMFNNMDYKMKEKNKREFEKYSY